MMIAFLLACLTDLVLSMDPRVWRVPQVVHNVPDDEEEDMLRGGGVCALSDHTILNSDV